jgi:hypothetical protein
LEDCKCRQSRMTAWEEDGDSDCDVSSSEKGSPAALHMGSCAKAVSQVRVPFAEGAASELSASTLSLAAGHGQWRPLHMTLEASRPSRCCVCLGPACVAICPHNNLGEDSPTQDD